MQIVFLNIEFVILCKLSSRQFAENVKPYFLKKKEKKKVVISLLSVALVQRVLELKQELRQARHYTPVASNKMQHINWLLYNSVLRI